MSEYIGSQISLISKSDIKYIGTLHEINSDTHTVALESVTSYGTEGRKGNPAEEIPGSDNVYEYIVFRGSDVKELKIVAPPGAKENQPPPQMPNDPAILGSARPAPQNQPPPQQQLPPNHDQFRGPPPPPYPQQHPQFGYQGPPPPNQFPNQPRFQGPGGPHGFPGTPGAVPGYGMGFGPPPPGYFGPPPGQGFPQQPPPGNFGPNQQPPMGPPGQEMNQQRPPQQLPAQPQMPTQQQQPIGSKQGTPQPPGSQGPTPPSQPAPAKPVEMSATPSLSDLPTGPPPPVETKPPVSAAIAPSAASQHPPTAPKAVPKTSSRVAVPLPNNLAAKPPQKPVAPSQPVPSSLPAQQPQSGPDATQAATAAVAAAMAKLGPVNQTQVQPQAAGTDNLTQKVNQMRIHDQQRSRGRAPRGSAPRGGRRESAPKQKVDVPKEDFDFVSANAKFNLVKESIASGSSISSPTNGDKADPLATPNGDIDGERDLGEDVFIPPAAKPSTEKSYDKGSSFFDNISSDLKDRTEQDTGAIDGRNQRREERTKNVETFGQGSVDQGGYRGSSYRGRGRGRGFNNNYRGGGYGGGRGGYVPRGAYGGRGGRGAAETTFA